MSTLWAFVAAHSIPAIGAILFFEELGIPSPIPGDVMMVLAGTEAALGHTSLWLALMVEEVATVAGAGTLYVLTSRFGRGLVERFGPLVGITQERLDTAEARLRRRGRRTVFVGRILPGTRILTVIAAGVVRVPPAEFLPSLVAGSSIYLLAYTLLGYWFGPAATRFLARVSLSLTTLLSIALLALAFLALRRLRSPAWARQYAEHPLSPFVTGLAAGFVALLAANVLFGVAAAVRTLLGLTGPFGLQRAPGPLAILVGGPPFIAATVSVALVESWLARRGYGRGVRVALVVATPFALTLTAATVLGASPWVDLRLGVSVAIRWLIVAGVLLALPDRATAQAPAPPALTGATPEA